MFHKALTISSGRVTKGVGPQGEATTARNRIPIAAKPMTMSVRLVSGMGQEVLIWLVMEIDIIGNFLIIFYIRFQFVNIQL